MEILGTHFAITLGSWRLRLVLCVEEIEDEATRRAASSHHVAVIRDSNDARTTQR
ncbi:MAG: hypothetical protein M3Z14_05620 [Candidatus Eremiobacteraeota bacterium]|nr:hypothetical protein [Candidatus Eremiobacteraeota bacterium]